MQVLSVIPFGGAAGIPPTLNRKAKATHEAKKHRHISSSKNAESRQPHWVHPRNDGYKAKAEKRAGPCRIPRRHQLAPDLETPLDGWNNGDAVACGSGMQGNACRRGREAARPPVGRMGRSQEAVEKAPLALSSAGGSEPRTRQKRASKQNRSGAVKRHGPIANCQY